MAYFATTSRLPFIELLDKVIKFDYFFPEVLGSFLNISRLSRRR